MTAQAIRVAAPHFLSGGGEMGGLIRQYDWRSSSLGAPDRWPQSLKTAIRIMLTSRQPIWIGWGRDLTYFYNDAYKSIIGGKHPWALGRPTREVWNEIWDDIGPLLATAMKGVEGTYVESQLLIMERNGYEEETYYTFSYSPIPDDGEDAAGGIICANTDDTSKVIGERQLALLTELAARTADARTWQEVCTRAAAALETNPRDIPFAALYIGETHHDTLLCVGRSGLAQGPELAPDAIPQDGGSVWPLGDCIASGKLKLFPASSLPSTIRLPWGAWSKPPQQIAAIPVPAAGGVGQGGVLIAGLNPYRLFDDAYRDFLGLVAGQIAKGINNANAYEGERRRAESLAELDRAKTIFFTNISHEFRTPLTLMLGPLEDLKGELHLLAPSSQHAAVQLDLAHRNGLRLLKLVNTLLDFSRLEAGKLKADFETTDLAAFTAELASVFRSAIEKAGLRLIVDCPPLTAPVSVDRDMWEKIVLNFLSNALKFTFEGEIEVKLRQTGKFIELTVRDTGIGISASELPHIFERFHRVSGARGRSHEGSGIGLALVQELVRLHGGSVAAESVEGKGSTFRALIPAGVEKSPKSAGAGSANRALKAAGARPFVEEALRWLPASDAEMDEAERIAPSAGPGSRPRIVLADDNADMRAYVGRLLSAQFDVDEAADGMQALDIVLNDLPDLVLCDVMMPRLDGFAFLRELRARPETRALPIILLSARAGEEARLEGIEAGADDYLVKPFSARELLARVGSTLDLARARSTAAERERELRMEAETARERLESVLAGIDDQFIVFDHDWSYIYVNDRVLEVTGKTREELIGHSLWRVFPDVMETDFYRVAVKVSKEREADSVSFFYKPYRRWFQCRFYPSSEGIAAVITDISEAKRAEVRTLGQRRILEMVAAGTPLKETLDELLRFIESQESGMRGSILLATDNGLRFKRVSSPGMREDFCEDFDRVMEGLANKPPGFAPCPEAIGRRSAVLVPDLAAEKQFSAEWRELLIANGYRAVRSTGIFGADGRLLGTFALYYELARDPNPDDVELVDIATHLAAIAIERDKSEAALRESEATLRAFYDNAPVFMGIVEPDHRGDIVHIYDNPASCELLDAKPGQTVGKRSIADFGARPDLIEKWLECFRHTEETDEPVRFEIPAETKGEVKWLAVTVCALGLGPSGRMRFCYVAEDITERRRTQERQTLLTNELNHRVKNTLAVVQAIAEQTARFSPQPEVFKRSFSGRIGALARVHDVLTETSWSGTSLEAVVQASVSPFNGGGAIIISGPHVDLEPGSAVTLSLALNELATNAAKYGALTTPQGSIQLAWRANRDGSLLELLWKEHGGPEVFEPQHKGFGSRLLERLASQLDGSVRLDYLKDGVRCEFKIPLAEGKVR
jgi:PAS domain S-box-containing protein